MRKPLSKALQQLRAEHVTVDEPIPWDIYDGDGHLLLSKGHVVDGELAEELLLRGMFVDAEEFPLRTRWSTLPVTFNPFRLWDESYSKLSRLLKEVGKQNDFQSEIEALGKQMQLICETDTDAAISLIMLHDMQRYTISHALHVATIADLVARRMGWSAEDQLRTVCAALTMNIAMLDLQTKLVHQIEAPTNAQREEIRQHPTKGCELLRNAGVTDEGWLNAVWEHHESAGGKGYPRQLETVNQIAEVVHFADVFCAMLCDRAHRRGMLPNQVAKELFVHEGHGGKNPIPGMIIKETGIYPPGSFVKLANGETALVVRRGESASAPTVVSLSSGEGIPYMEPRERSTRSPGFEIVAMLSRELIITRLDTNKIWGY